MNNLSIIIPVYNEAATIRELLDRVRRVFDATDISYEIIVVNDGSTDDTATILRKYEGEIILIDQKNAGKGAAIHTGLDRATGTYTVIQDGDLEYDPADIVTLYTEAKKKNVKAIYGSRNTGNNKRGTFLFYWGGRLVTSATNLLFKQRLTDEATCYKLIRTDLLKSFSLRERGFAFCPEVTSFLAKDGITIPELPISYTPRDSEHGKKIRWRDGVIALWTLWRLRFPHTLQLMTVGVITFLLYLATWQGGFGGYEGETAQSAINLLNGDYAPGRAGITATLMYLPFVALLKLLSIDSLLPLTLVPIGYSVLTVLCLYGIIWKLKHNERLAMWGSILLGVATMLWPYTNIGMEYQATLWLSALLLGLLHWKSTGKMFWATLAFLLLTTSKSYGIMFGLPVVLFIYVAMHGASIKEQFKAMVRAVLPASIAFALTMILQILFQNSATGVYSLAHEFQVWTWWEGFYGIFFSAGKSIFLFNPLLFVALFYLVPFYKKHTPSAIFIYTAFALLLLLTAPFSYWTDETWGVRKLVPVLPLLHLPLLVAYQHLDWNRIKKILASGLVAIAIYIQFLGAAYYYGTQLSILREMHLDSLHHLRHTPTLSHPVLYHHLFKNFISDKNESIIYSEKTWFRWTVGKEDILLDQSKLNTKQWQQPNIIWLPLY